jgi:hypothetical protein
MDAGGWAVAVCGAGGDSRCERAALQPPQEISGAARGRSLAPGFSP